MTMRSRHLIGLENSIPQPIAIAATPYVTTDGGLRYVMRETMKKHCRRLIEQYVSICNLLVRTTPEGMY